MSLVESLIESRGVTTFGKLTYTAMASTIGAITPGISHCGRLWSVLLTPSGVADWGLKAAAFKGCSWESLIIVATARSVGFGVVGRPRIGLGIGHV